MNSEWTCFNIPPPHNPLLPSTPSIPPTTFLWYVVHNKPSLLSNSFPVPPPYHSPSLSFSLPPFLRSTERNLLMVGFPLIIADPRREQPKWRAPEKKTRTGTTKSHPVIYNYQSSVSNHSGKSPLLAFLYLLLQCPLRVSSRSVCRLVTSVQQR